MDTELFLERELEKAVFLLEQATQRLDEYHDYLDPTWLALEAEACALRARVCELEELELEWARARRRTLLKAN